MGNNQSSSSSHSHSRENSSNSSGMKPSISTSSLRSRSSTLTSDSRTMISGGFLEPQSLLYSHVEYHRPTVHKLIVDHKLSPFYLGLNDFEPDWEIDQLVQALVEAEQQATQNLKDALTAQSEQVTECEANQLNAPQGTRKQKEATQAYSLAVMRQERLKEMIKIRDKRGGGGLQWTPKGDQAKLYKTCALECPICFLYYPPNMVHTRCCDQPICTECFVQIKRAEPTPTHLESEPAACPFCMEPNFGCVYEKPAPTRPVIQQSGSESSSDQVATPPKSPKPRRKSFAHTEKEVVTTDMLHPDWESKLEAMKATVARRANRRIVFRQVGDRLIPVGITSGRAGDGANATMATQTLPPDFLSQIAAALDHSNNPESSSSGGGGSSSGGRSGFRVRSSRRRGGSTGNSAGENDEVNRLLESLGLGGGPDLEEMMLQEAMRLSQLEEEERQKKVKEEEEKKQREQEGLGGASSMNRKSTETTTRELSEAMGYTLSQTQPQPPTTSFPSASTSQAPLPTINTTLPPLSHNDPNSTSTPTSATTPTATTFPSSSSALPPIESTSFLGDVLAPSTSRASESSASFVQTSPMAGYQQLEDDDAASRTSKRQESQEHLESSNGRSGGTGGGNLIDF